MLSGQHSAAFSGHSTPLNVVRFIQEVFKGNEFLDAASDPLSQSLLMKAPKVYMPPDHDGLTDPWAEYTVVNPPGGGMRQWFEKALSEWSKGNCREIVFVGFSTSVLRLNQEIYAYNLPHLSPKTRMRFWCQPKRMIWQKFAKANRADPSAELRFFEAVKTLPDVSTWNDTKTLCAVVDEIGKAISIGGDIAKARDRVAKLSRFVAKRKGEGLHRSNELGALCESDSPSHDNVLVFFPDIENLSASVQKFYTLYEDHELGETPISAGDRLQNIRPYRSTVFRGTQTRVAN